MGFFKKVKKGFHKAAKNVGHSVVEGLHDAGNIKIPSALQKVAKNHYVQMGMPPAGQALFDAIGHSDSTKDLPGKIVYYQTEKGKQGGKVLAVAGEWMVVAGTVTGQPEIVAMGMEADQMSKGLMLATAGGENLSVAIDEGIHGHKGAAIQALSKSAQEYGVAFGNYWTENQFANVLAVTEDVMRGDYDQAQKDSAAAFQQYLMNRAGFQNNAAAFGEQNKKANDLLNPKVPPAHMHGKHGSNTNQEPPYVVKAIDKLSKINRRSQDERHEVYDDAHTHHKSSSQHAPDAQPVISKPDVPLPVPVKEEKHEKQLTKKELKKTIKNLERQKETKVLFGDGKFTNQVHGTMPKTPIYTTMPVDNMIELKGGSNGEPLIGLPDASRFSHEDFFDGEDAYWGNVHDENYLNSRFTAFRNYLKTVLGVGPMMNGIFPLLESDKLPVRNKLFNPWHGIEVDVTGKSDDEIDAKKQQLQQIWVAYNKNKQGVQNASAAYLLARALGIWPANFSPTWGVHQYGHSGQIAPEIRGKKFVRMTNWPTSHPLRVQHRASHYGNDFVEVTTERNWQEEFPVNPTLHTAKLNTAIETLTTSLGMSYVRFGPLAFASHYEAYWRWQAGNPNLKFIVPENLYNSMYATPKERNIQLLNATSGFPVWDGTNWAYKKPILSLAGNYYFTAREQDMIKSMYPSLTLGKPLEDLDEVGLKVLQKTDASNPPDTLSSAHFINSSKSWLNQAGEEPETWYLLNLPSVAGIADRIVVPKKDAPAFEDPSIHKTAQEESLANVVDPNVDGIATDIQTEITLQKSRLSKEPVHQSAELNRLKGGANVVYPNEDLIYGIKTFGRLDNKTIRPVQRSHYAIGGTNHSLLRPGLAASSNGSKYANKKLVKKYEENSTKFNMKGKPAVRSFTANFVNTPRQGAQVGDSRGKKIPYSKSVRSVPGRIHRDEIAEEVDSSMDLYKTMVRDHVVKTADGGSKRERTVASGVNSQRKRIKHVYY